MVLWNVFVALETEDLCFSWWYSTSLGHSFPCHPAVILFVILKIPENRIVYSYSTVDTQQSTTALFIACHCARIASLPCNCKRPGPGSFP